MKIEARILVSRCSHDLCASVILRGRAFDTLILARDCLNLCETLKSRGYMYELRYSTGDCSCNLPKPPRTPEFLEDIMVFLEKLTGTISELKLIRVKLENHYR